MVTKTNILKHELIGLDVEVVDANNKSQIGLKGKVVDETRNTLIIKSQKGEKKILKKEMKSIIPLFIEKSSVKVMHHSNEKVSLINRPAKYGLTILLTFYMIRFFIARNIKIDYIK